MKTNYTYYTHYFLHLYVVMFFMSRFQVQSYASFPNLCITIVSDTLQNISNVRFSRFLFLIACFGTAFYVFFRIFATSILT